MIPIQQYIAQTAPFPGANYDELMQYFDTLNTQEATGSVVGTTRLVPPPGEGATTCTTCSVPINAVSYYTPNVVTTETAVPTGPAQQFEYQGSLALEQPKTPLNLGNPLVMAGIAAVAVFIIYIYDSYKDKHKIGG